MATDPFGDQVFRSLAVDPTDAHTLYVGTEENGLVKSTDGGFTWTRLRRGIQHGAAAAVARHGAAGPGFGPEDEPVLDPHPGFPMNLRSSFLLLAAVLAVPAAAQDLAAARSGTGVHALGDHVRATGPGYTARFDATGFEFVPLQGAAPEVLSLCTRLIAVQRGDAAVCTAAGDAPPPAVDGRHVHRDHGAVVESYDVRPDGIEQRFVLAERPAGRGDLVVRLAVTTGLALVAADARAGLRYEASGCGGVTIGGVTGIDADGRTATGTIRADGAHLEYVLPAAFVDAARYPLVVDPLFGSAFLVGNAASGTDEAPDVAYDATNLCWLVVWRVATSSVQGEVRAQRVSFTGTLLGPQLLIDASTTIDHRPRVANVNATDAFVVAYVHRSVSGSIAFYRLELRTVAAATGAVSGFQAVLSAWPDDFAVGGESRPSVFGFNENALLVYIATSSSGPDVKSVLVHVPTGAVPAVTGSFQTLTSTAGSHGQLTVTRHAGANGRWLAAWGYSQPGNPTPPYQQIGACVIDWTGNVCTAWWQMAAGAVQTPSVATRDGAQFAIAWEDEAADQIRVRTVSYTNTCGTGGFGFGPELSPATSLGLASNPALDFATDKYVLAWRSSNLLQPTRILAKSLDPDTCAACGSEHVVESSATAQNRPAVAAWRSGASGQQDTALIAWDSGGAIRARRFEATGGGSNANLVGQCGPSGSNLASFTGSPTLGDDDFALTLQNASTPAVALVVGLSNVSIPCGPCTLVPAIDATVSGGTTVPLPIPCDLSWLGLTFWTQWLVLEPGGCAAFPDLALSNALRFTVGE